MARRQGKGRLCGYCERQMEAKTSRSKLAATLDHVHPKSKGGTEKIWCCRQCNEIKADMTVEEWLAFRQNNPRWWVLPEYEHRGRQHRHSTFSYRDSVYILKNGKKAWRDARRQGVV